jgi:hypothetical protein
MPLKAGSAFFIPSTGGFFNPSAAHLFVCLTGPDAKGNVITVSIMTLRANLDQACVLSVGDHPFIKHKSCANYMKANLLYAPTTEKEIAAGNYKSAVDVDPAVLVKLRKGLLASGNTPDFILAEAKKRGLK